MITGIVLRNALLIAAAMLIAVGLLDWISEFRRGSLLRFGLTFATLAAYTFGLQALLR